MNRDAGEFTFQPKTTAVRYLSASASRKLKAKKAERAPRARALLDPRIVAEDENVEPDSNGKAEIEVEIEMNALHTHPDDTDTGIEPEVESEGPGNIPMNEIPGRDVGEGILMANDLSWDSSSCSRSCTCSESADSGRYRDRHNTVYDDEDIDNSSDDSSKGLDEGIAGKERSLLDASKSGVDKRILLSNSSSSFRGSGEGEKEVEAADVDVEIIGVIHKAHDVVCNQPMSNKFIPNNSHTHTGQVAKSRTRVETSVDDGVNVGRAGKINGEEKTMITEIYHDKEHRNGGDAPNRGDHHCDHNQNQVRQSCPQRDASRLQFSASYYSVLY